MKLKEVDNLLLTKEDSDNINKLEKLIKDTEEKVQKFREETVKELTIEQGLNGIELEKSNDKYAKLIRMKYDSKGRDDKIVVSIGLFLIGLTGVVLESEIKWLSCLLVLIGAISTYLSIKGFIINKKVRKNLDEFNL